MGLFDPSTIHHAATRVATETYQTLGGYQDVGLGPELPDVNDADKYIDRDHQRKRQREARPMSWVVLAAGLIAVALLLSGGDS